ncbi:hypothetical protein ACJJTC_018694 [Scirpophaga incertulas]
MLEPWNDPSIMAPPINTTFIHGFEDIEDLSYACNSIIKVLSNQLPLHNESALLSRFIYKFDKKFRNDIGYRIMKKVNTALRKYLQLNLIKDVKSFIAVVPSSNTDIYLPTLQMLQFILLRIITFSKIMIRICTSSKQAAIYYMDRVQRGESHWMSLMPFALLSRIWSLSLVLAQNSCSWYLNLYPYLNKLQVNGVEFLPLHFKFPSDLGIFLDIQNIDKFGRLQWSVIKKKINVKVDFAEDYDFDLDSILEYVKEVNKDDTVRQNELGTEKKITLIKPTELVVGHNDLSDLGQSVPREYFKTFFNQVDKQDNNSHSVLMVTDKSTLNLFIDNEEKFRIENSSKSLTRHLSFMQWHSLKTNLSKVSDCLSNNRKIQRKFNKIWREKCLETDNK